MEMFNVKKTSTYDVRKWIEEIVPEITAYQNSKLWEEEWYDKVRYSEYVLYKKQKKKTPNFFLRLTMPFAWLIWLIMLVCLPVNYIITGDWKYDHRIYDYIFKWMDKVLPIM